jgi:hypothetical protein
VRAVFRGTESAPSWGTAATTYVRTQKFASDAFSFYTPSPSIVYARWCKTCANIGTNKNCVELSGKCADGVAPKDGIMPIDGSGTLTIVMESIPPVKFSVSDNSVTAPSAVTIQVRVCLPGTQVLNPQP